MIKILLQACLFVVIFTIGAFAEVEELTDEDCLKENFNVRDSGKEPGLNVD